MSMAKKYFQLIIPFLVFVLIGIYGTFSTDFILRQQSIDMTYKWFSLPAAILAVYFAYRATFGYDKKKLRQNIIGIIVLSVGCFVLFFTAFEGYLIIYNCNVGEQRAYQLKGQIQNIKITKTRGGRLSYTITIYQELEKDNVELTVPSNIYYEGQYFSEKMKIGSLGFIYNN